MMFPFRFTAARLFWHTNDILRLPTENGTTPSLSLGLAPQRHFKKACQVYDMPSFCIGRTMDPTPCFFISKIDSYTAKGDTILMTPSWKWSHSVVKLRTRSLLLEPQCRYGHKSLGIRFHKSLGIRVNKSPKRDCGSESVKSTFQKKNRFTT